MIALLQNAPAIRARAIRVAQVTQWENDARFLAAQARKEQAAGHPAQAFADYVHLLQTFPAGVPVGAGHVGTGRYYAHILSQLLATARQLRTLPPLPSAYRREIVVGLADVRSAKTATDYTRAEGHFLKAARLAPWNPLPYDALGHLLESQKHYREAANYFRFYLLVQPNAPNAQALQDRIYVLEDHGR